MKTERMLPDIYAQSWDMRTLCRIFDAEFNLLEYYTKHILDCYSPQHCPENLLSELAEHIGFDYNEFKTVMYNRVVLKHFIRDMIRYRGSAKGIAQAAAIDIRYRQVYPDFRQYWDSTNNQWVVIPDEEAGNQVPMSYTEGIPLDNCWIDADHQQGIIYLFIIAEHYFPKAPNANAGSAARTAYTEECMRRLLDLAHLQEYVRPVGMYLLPMVAKKVNPRTDLTVKAVRIPTNERNTYNGVTGTPNASLEHKYDRMNFARLDPGEIGNIEPWIRTLYHSQIAGRVDRQYFTKPVYHIEGKFLYYDHDELQNIYKEIMESSEGTLGMKVGDSLYNPNFFTSTQNYSYGNDPQNEPDSLQDEGKAILQTEPLRYDDHGMFDGVDRYAQTIPVPEIEPVPQNAYPTFLYADLDDSGTDKNMMINLFDVDANDEGIYTGAHDISIPDKGPVPRNPVPYNPATNDSPDGTDVWVDVKNSEGKPDEEIIP